MFYEYNKVSPNQFPYITEVKCYFAYHVQNVMKSWLQETAEQFLI